MDSDVDGVVTTLAARQDFIRAELMRASAKVNAYFKSIYV
jgi:hypothetical protein